MSSIESSVGVKLLHKQVFIRNTALSNGDILRTNALESTAHYFSLEC